MDKLNAKDEAARAATSAQRNEIIALRESKKEQLSLLEATKAEAEVLRGQVVASPARLKAEVSSLEASVEAEQRAVDEVEEQKRLLMRRLEIVACGAKNVNKFMVLGGEAEVSIARFCIACVRRVRRCHHRDSLVEPSHCIHADGGQAAKERDEGGEGPQSRGRGCCRRD